MRPRPTSGPTRAARRRLAALAGATAAVGLVALAGVPSAWPLLALPIVLAGPLAGWSALAATTAVAGLAMVALAGAPGAGALELAAGLVAFAAAGTVAGAMRGSERGRLARVAEISLTDRLTGLYNYAFFADALARECRRAERYGGPVSLVLLDLDHFKGFNDTHGHAAGNRLLAEVGRVLGEERRATDVVARFGGEEFAVLVPGPLREAAEAAERIRRAVAHASVSVPGGGRDGRTVSAGVAERVPGTGAERLVEEADRALYRSKGRGRNRVSVAGAAPAAVAG
jgi:diguanylate cyclase (GGDEF)-like protein